MNTKASWELSRRFRRVLYGLFAVGFLFSAAEGHATTVQIDYKFSDPVEHSAFIFTVGGQGEFLLEFDVDPNDNGAWLTYEEGSSVGYFSYNVRAINGRLRDKATGNIVERGGDFRIWTAQSYEVTASDGTFDDAAIDGLQFQSTAPIAGFVHSAGVPILLNNTDPNGVTWEGPHRNFLNRPAAGGITFLATPGKFSQWPGLEFGYGDTHWVPHIVAVQRSGGGTEVPEPGTLLLLGSSLAAFRARRRKQH